jgi:hypothetical protein
MENLYPRWGHCIWKINKDPTPTMYNRVQEVMSEGKTMVTKQNKVYYTHKSGCNEINSVAEVSWGENCY